MIDIHTHPVMVRELVEKDRKLAAAVRDVFGLRFPSGPLELFYRELDEAGVDQAVLLPIDCTHAHGCAIVTNDQIARLVAETHRFIGFCSVDPHLPGAGGELERAVSELRLVGLKLDPALQRFNPSSRAHAFPLYERCLALDIPVMIHCGMSLAPGGASRFARPISLEPALEQFPDLKLIVPHLGWPYVEEALMLSVRYRNVYLDTSVLYAGAPKDTLRHLLLKRLGAHVVEAIAFRLLFGSNYPRVDIRRSVRAVRELEVGETVRENILGRNAARLLGMDDSRPETHAKEAE